MKTCPKPAKGTDLLDFMLLYAKQYLASGGPTSRLEESLYQIGQYHNRHTEIFATPTGVFVTVQDIERKNDPVTSLLRLRDTGTDLGTLCKLEHVYTSVVEGRLPLRAGLETLKHSIITRPLYSIKTSCFAALVGGMAFSFNSYQRPSAAIVSGLITGLVWLSTPLFLKRHFNNPIFTDFMGAFITLVLAALAHGYFETISLEAYALGGIILLVPGLSITTAISELAEQNLVSGTAKLMQASMALLALGLAYLLFQQIAYSLDLREALAPVAAAKQDFWISGICTLIGVASFGVLFKVPPKALIWSTLTGMAGWLTISAVSSTKAAAGAPFIAALVVGLVSSTLGRIWKQPSQVYSVPGIVAMLPGMLALSSFRYFATGDQNSGIAFTFKVAVTAVSITFGLMTARIPFTLGGEYKKHIIPWLERVQKYEQQLRSRRTSKK